MDAVWAQVERLRKSAVTVRDPALRAGLARELVASLDPVALVDLVTGLVVAVERGDPLRADVLLFVTVALADPAFAPLRADAALAAALRGQSDMARLLAKDEGGAGPARTARVPDFGVGRPLTLGERKSLARTKDRRLILKALRDPDQSVIRILLGNPRLTEDDVIRLVAHRPIDAAILMTVFRDVRWIVRYRVRRTLVMNPDTPLDVAQLLALQLNEQDAKLVLDSGSLRAEIRAVCRRRIAAMDGPLLS